MPQEPKRVDDSSARTVAGATGGLCETAVSDSAATTFTVTEWAGRYIKINPCGGDVWYLFSSNGTAGTAFDETAEAAAAASADDTIPDRTANGAPEHEVVPSYGTDKAVYLHVQKVSGAGPVRVRPS